MLSRQRSHVAARHVFQNDVMKSCTCQVDGGAVSKAADDVRVSHAIESNGLVLKILNQRLLQLHIRSSLKKRIERFDDYRSWSIFRGCVVPSYVDFRIATATQTFNDVVATVEPALL